MPDIPKRRRASTVEEQFQLSVSNPVWRRGSQPQVILTALAGADWRVGPYCQWLDATWAPSRSNDLLPLSERTEQRIQEIAAELEAALPSATLVEDTVSAIAEFSFRYLTKYFPFIVSVGSLNLYQLPYSGDFLPSCTSGLDADTELLHDHVITLLGEGDWDVGVGTQFIGYFEATRKKSPDQRRGLIVKRLPRAIRSLTEEILLSGVEHMEAYYRLLDVSGVRRTGSCSPIRLHPNPYELIASDALSIWVGDRELIDLFANEPQQNAQ